MLNHGTELHIQNNTVSTPLRSKLPLQSSRSVPHSLLRLILQAKTCGPASDQSPRSFITALGPLIGPLLRLLVIGLRIRNYPPSNSNESLRILVSFEHCGANPGLHAFTARPVIPPVAYNLASEARPAQEPQTLYLVHAVLGGHFGFIGEATLVRPWPVLKSGADVLLLTRSAFRVSHCSATASDISTLISMPSFPRRAG